MLKEWWRKRKQPLTFRADLVPQLAFCSLLNIQIFRKTLNSRQSHSVSRRDPNKNRTLCNQVLNTDKMVNHTNRQMTSHTSILSDCYFFTKYSYSSVSLPFSELTLRYQSENSPLPITIHPDTSQLAEPSPKSPNASPHSSSPFKTVFNCLIEFWLHWVFVAAQGFSSCGDAGAWAPPCISFSHCRAQVLSVQASVVAVPRL